MAWFKPMLVASLAIGPATAHGDALPIERIFAGPSLAGDVAQGVRIAPDGTQVGYLRAAKDDPAATILWMMPTRGGKPRALLDTRRLGKASGAMTEEQIKLLERRHQASAAPLDYWWSARGDRILAAYDGDLFEIGVRDGAIRRLTKTAATELDPQLAPDGRHVSFLRDRNLIVRSIADGSEQALGEDVSDTISYGTVEFVAQEEIQRFTGQWWSIDGTRIAYTRVDESKVTALPRIAIGTATMEVVNDRFPLTGTANAEVRLFIRGEAGAAAPVEVDLGQTRDIYIAHCAWSVDGRTFYVLRQSRDQKRLDLLGVDPATGRSRVLVSQTDKNWVTLERDFRPLSDGSFLWGSSRSGWHHLYHYRADGTPIRQVTSGKWRLANPAAAASPEFKPVIAVDERAGEVYFLASIDTPIEQRLYRISYRRDDVPHALTPPGGWWDATMAPGAGGGFVATYSDPATPPNTALYDLAGKRTAWIAENRLNPSHPMWRYLDHRPSYSYGSIKAANGADLYYSMAKPAGFDPAKRYPVIVNIYGGPGVQTVRRVWRGASGLTPPDQVLAQAGYIVFGLDNRGMTNRDEAFEHGNAGELGVLAGIDQNAGIDFLKRQPFVDPDRIGMMGWSFGGYTTVRVMTTPGHGLRAGAAGGVPSDFTLYDTHYTERFLGAPQDNPAGYARSNLKPRLKDLTGSLLVAQGLSDDNVLLPNFTTLVDGLQQAGIVFDTIVYPGQSHQLRGAATLKHLWRSYLDFFDRTMAPRPAGAAK